MKVRIAVPESVIRARDSSVRQDFADDILMWAMETEIDAALYAFVTEGYAWANDKKMWAVFTIDPDWVFMFSLKWGATLHKDKMKVAH